MQEVVTTLYTQPSIYIMLRQKDPVLLTGVFRNFHTFLQEILESSTLPKRPPPSHLVCPLTKQLFVDPVQTPRGYVYERHAIEAALNTLPKDPLDGEPLRKADLNPATSVRRQASDFRESLAKVAACWLN